MPFQVWPYLNNRCRTIVKMELNYPVLGQGMERGGAVFVTRASEEGRATLNQAGKEAKTEEHSLLVFPEGTRTLSPTTATATATTTAAATTTALLTTIHGNMEPPTAQATVRIST